MPYQSFFLIGVKYNIIYQDYLPSNFSKLFGTSACQFRDTLLLWISNMYINTLKNECSNLTFLSEKSQEQRYGETRQHRGELGVIVKHGLYQPIDSADSGQYPYYHADLLACNNHFLVFLDFHYVKFEIQLNYVGKTQSKDNKFARLLYQIFVPAKKKNVKHTCKKYIVRRAKSVLIEGVSVSSTAYCLGFNYPAHLTRLFQRIKGMQKLLWASTTFRILAGFFRKSYGMTPSQFRANHHP